MYGQLVFVGRPPARLQMITYTSDRQSQAYFQLKTVTYLYGGLASLKGNVPDSHLVHNLICSVEFAPVLTLIFCSEKNQFLLFSKCMFCPL